MRNPYLKSAWIPSQNTWIPTSKYKIPHSKVGNNYIYGDAEYHSTIVLQQYLTLSQVLRKKKTIETSKIMQTIGVTKINIWYLLELEQNCWRLLIMHYLVIMQR